MQRNDYSSKQYGVTNEDSFILSPFSMAIIAILVTFVVVAVYVLRTEKTPEQALRELENKTQKQV
jgi:uncharacterized membrane protein (DUF485 family)